MPTVIINNEKKEDNCHIFSPKTKAKEVKWCKLEQPTVLCSVVEKVF